MERRKAMSKLSPKQLNKRPKETWEDLDKRLQAVFSDPIKDSDVINLNQYQMTKSEIISELAKAGYTTEDTNDGYLVVR
ncbi:TPA: hypothetical protein VM909_001357 [Streptococcus pyogenes]|nr:hypothetical protein HMPREF0841_0781 [Streptococcus pyogenes ATCC 10782]MBM6513398.1 hypothetical protein [Streptococcus dysgalactiae subsp. equisimilis]NTS59381.1 hypothetical protein [Streptococcus pyogenes]QET83798.1 hypothetical protein FOB62_05940 [Streptococcus dysgalactiae]HER4515404.1 hypothetical protein [Streptococcus pyogenes NGAS743]HER4524271.1 hypothetical protein [Streptococcus pyogenes NGAS747]HER4527676.1 hypothetical protein [Streptococcus pyogenes NGAS739]HER4539254.1 h